jgi:hypothetical protein
MRQRRRVQPHALGNLAYPRATVVAVGLGVSLALLLGAATVALAAVPGVPFKLGKVNTINAVSTMVGNVSGSMLTVDNNSTGLGATDLDLRVEPNRDPSRSTPRRRSTTSTPTGSTTSTPVISSRMGAEKSFPTIPT